MLTDMVRWGWCRWRFVGIVVMLLNVVRRQWCTALVWIDLDLFFCSVWMVVVDVA